LIKAWSAWDRLDGGDPDGYVRKVVINTQLSWRRRRWSGETPTRDLPEQAANGYAQDPMSAVDEYDRLWRVLGRLPPRQRAVVVLRYFEDLSQDQIAAVLEISVGGVKSQLSRALAALRLATELRAVTELRPTTSTTSPGATDVS
jgi:RNA polymerase sigma-70 factor (sigma-E family)